MRKILGCLTVVLAVLGVSGCSGDAFSSVPSVGVETLGSFEFNVWPKNVRDIAFDKANNKLVVVDWESQDNLMFFDTKTGAKTGSVQRPEFDRVSDVTFGKDGKIYMLRATRRPLAYDFMFYTCGSLSLDSCATSMSWDTFGIFTYDADRNLVWAFQDYSLVGLDPVSLTTKKKINKWAPVSLSDNPSSQVYDMEYVDGKLWILYSGNRLLCFDIEQGRLVSQASLKHIWKQYGGWDTSDLSSLAYDGEKFWVTGKNWHDAYSFKVE